MNAPAQKLLEDALRLPQRDRAELAASLIDSLDPGVDEDAPAAWASEIERRIAELEQGTVKPVPWPEARRMIVDDDGGSPEA